MNNKLNADDLTNKKKSVSTYTITYMYRENKIAEYLKTLDDLELELALINFKDTEKDEEVKNILDFINAEKAYRHYSKILEGLKAGKAK